MKNQALFPSKDKSKNLKCRLLQFLFGALSIAIDHFFRIGLECSMTGLSWTQKHCKSADFFIIIIISCRG